MEIPVRTRRIIASTEWQINETILKEAGNDALALPPELEGFDPVVSGLALGAIHALRRGSHSAKVRRGARE